jgi:hypothetical protein
MTPVEIAALLNGVMKLGIAWAEYGALIDRARRQGREVTPEDVADLGRRARVALNGLGDAIAEAEQATATETPDNATTKP